MTPLIYTSSPIEAHIIAVFMRAQTAMAAFFHGTPVFRGLLFAALTWAVLHQFLRIGTSRHQAGHAVVTIAYRIGMVFLSIALLSWATEGVTLSSAEGPWATYSAVQSDPNYADTLNGQTRSLWAYTMIYQAIDGVAQASVNAASQAFNDDQLRRDPMFLAEQLGRMESFALSPPTESAWGALAAECAKQNAPDVPLNPNAPIQALFDLNTTNCQARWDAFQQLARADGDALIQKYPDYVVRHMLEALSTAAPGVGRDQLAQVAVGFALQNTVKDSAAVAEESAKTGSSPQNVTAPQGEDAPRDETRNKVNNTVLQMVGDAEETNTAGFERLKDQVGMIMPLIPAARGYVEGILALLFVVAAYSVGFGTWKYLLMWCMAQASVCFYKPVALLGYKVTEYFMTEDAMRQQLITMGADGLALGGARVLHEQLSNIAAIYVAFELGAFLTFCVGAFALFRPLANLMFLPRNPAAGAEAARYLGMGASGTAVGTAAGATASGSTVIPGAAATAAILSIQRAGSGVGAEPLAVGGAGIQRSDVPPPSLWDQAQ